MKKEIPFAVGIVIIVIAAIIAGWAIYASEGMQPSGSQLIATVPTSSAPFAGAGSHCGGNTAHPSSCAKGYHCAPNPNSHLPFGDVGGTCVPDSGASSTINVDVGCSMVNGHEVCF